MIAMTHGAVNWRTKDGQAIPIHGRSEIHEMLEGAKNYICQHCFHPKVLHDPTTHKCNLKTCNCPGYAKMKNPVGEVLAQMPVSKAEKPYRDTLVKEMLEGVRCEYCGRTRDKCECVVGGLK